MLTFPRTVSGLVKIHTRARVGRRELRSRFPQMTVTDSKPRAVLARFLARHPRLLPEFTVYVTITLLASLRARLQCRHMSDYRWERDDSTRAPLDDGAGKTGALASVRHG